jgi:hypothetical protein
MAGLKIMAQAGYTPRVAPHLLQDSEAQRAINTKLSAGDLRSWKKPLQQVNRVFLSEDVKSIFKGKNSSGNPHWIAWNSDTDVVRSPLGDNINGMSIYYTDGDGAKKTNQDLVGTTQGVAPANFLWLGVPAPQTRPILAASGATSVSSVSVVSGGSGYLAAPDVTITGGGGSGATAKATVENGKVTAVTITNAGSGYTSSPTISFSGAGGTGAVASAFIGFVKSITVTAGGSGYTSVPTVTLTGGAGAGASAQAVVSGGAVTAIVVITKGRGYTSAPTISITGGGGTGATASPVMTIDAVAEVAVTAAGSNYGATVSFTGGGGTGATATATIVDGVITAVNLTNGGTGYTSLPTVVISGGAGTGAQATAAFRVVETRLYAYTYVSSFGDIEEESPPSPLSTSVNIASGQSVTVSNFAAPPTVNYNITHIRIYRSVTGSNSTSLAYVDQIAVGTSNYVDSITSAGLGETLGTFGWDMPPADLRGLVLLPNGFAAGFSGDKIYFSEVNAFHAWPSSYALSVGVEIVGLGVYGQSIAVMTKGYPYIVTGASPDGMSIEKVPTFEPCIAKRSIVSDSTGVLYASANGICGIGPGMSGVVTSNVMSRDDFLAFNPYSFTSGISGSKFFAFYEQASEFVKNGGLILDRTLSAAPLSTTTIKAKALHIDPETGDLYIATDGEIKTWDGDIYNDMPYEWLSKKFVFNAPTNLGAIEVNGDFNSIKTAALLQERAEQLKLLNQQIFASGVPLEGALDNTVLNARPLNGSILYDLPRVIDDRYLLITLIVDDKVIHNGQYTENGVYRLPSGYKGQVFEVKINGNIECRYLKMAETAKELKAL